LLVQEPGLDEHEWVTEWEQIEPELRESPTEALSEADDLVGRMMEARGFPLSEQDIHEGVVRWQLDRPYLNLQNSDGYCVHCTTGSRTCGVYVNRPGVCRTYDCRKDTRIWVDFEARVPQPDLP